MIFITITAALKNDTLWNLYQVLDGHISTRIAIQPIINLQTNEIYGHEILARWNDFPPDQIFALAEERNVVNILEELIVNKIRIKRPYIKGHMFVNIFPSIKHPEIFEYLSKENVILEITEASAINFQGVSKLKKMGFSIAIDDLGTGTATFDSLLKIRPNYLKLDKVLTQSFALEDRNSLFKAFVDHASRINAKVIVEGIETAEQLEASVKTGCHYGQGYFLGKPTILSSSNDIKLKHYNDGEGN